MIEQKDGGFDAAFSKTEFSPFFPFTGICSHPDELYTVFVISS